MFEYNNSFSLTGLTVFVLFYSLYEDVHVYVYVCLCCKFCAWCVSFTITEVVIISTVYHTLCYNKDIET